MPVRVEHRANARLLRRSERRRGQLTERCHQRLDAIGSAAVDEHQSIGSLERDDIGAAAGDERDPIVKREDCRLLGTGAARHDQAAEESADDRRKELSPVHRDVR